MTKEIDLTNFLPQEFGLNLQGGREVQLNNRRVESNPEFLEIEKNLISQIERDGVATLQLEDFKNMQFVRSLGTHALLKLALGLKHSGGRFRQVFATTTPDTSFELQETRFAFIGRLSSGNNIFVPKEMDPLELNPKQIDEALSQVITYLSAANQLGTVGEHKASSRISTADPRHLINALAEYNTGSLANKRINEVNPNERSHIGDTWERQNRSLLNIVSAQDSSNPTNDLVWDPITFTPTFRERAPFIAVFTPDILDAQSLMQKKIVPLTVNERGALESIQEMGFATIVKKGGLQSFAKSIERKMI